MSRLPAPMRALNTVGRAWRAAGMPARKLDPDALIQTAMHDTGLSDIGDPAEFRPGLDQVCTALEQLPELPTTGRFAARRQILRALRQRLRRREWLAQRPREFAKELRAPVVVVGLPRTGTTFLHRLLAASDNARALPMWEVAMPFPPLDGPDKRRQTGVRGAQMMKRVVPDIDRKHTTGADEPEECMHLQDEAFLSWSWFSNYPIPTYTRWLQQADPTHAYRVWSDVLRFVQGREPSARLTLKSPSHTAWLDALLDHAPDARLVWTHRDPAEVVPSFSSLVATTRGVSTTRQTADPHALGREICDHLAWLAERGMSHRPRIATGQLIDISFSSLRSDPLGTVAKIHAHFGIPWTPSTAQRVQAEIDGRPRGRHGSHQYDLSEFGLSEGLIQQQFGPYMALGLYK
jgi:hypothetical protein